MLTSLASLAACPCSLKLIQVRGVQLPCLLCLRVCCAVLSPALRGRRCCAGAHPRCVLCAGHDATARQGRDWHNRLQRESPALTPCLPARLPACRARRLPAQALMRLHDRDGNGSIDFNVCAGTAATAAAAACSKGGRCYRGGADGRLTVASCHATINWLTPPPPSPCAGV